MFQIYWGLKTNLDVSKYADPNIPAADMALIAYELKTGEDTSYYRDNFNTSQKKEILEWLEAGLNIEDYADPKLSAEELWEIRYSVQHPKTSSTPTTKKVIKSWKSLVNELHRESEHGIDSLYEGTAAGAALESIQKEVEDKMGIWLEPSIQAGRGSISFYSAKDNRALASSYDYQTFNDYTITLAIESKNKTEYKKAYKQYLENILNDPNYEPDYDEDHDEEY